MIEYATIDGVVLQDLSTNAVNIGVEKVEGLTGFPTIRGTIYDRPGGDGVVEPGNQFLGPRVSAWDVSVFGANIAAARTNWTTLMLTLGKAMRQPKQLRWRAVGDSLNLQADVRVAGMTPPIYDAGVSFFKCQILFRAADPTNYDQVLQSGSTFAPSLAITGLPLPIPFPIPWSLTPTGAGSVTLTNAGDAYAWPIIDIVGPISNPVVQNQTTGQTLYFDSLDVASGDTLHIVTQPSLREVSIAGVSKFGAIRFTDSNFFPVSPGATEVIQFSGSNTDPVLTTMAVYLRSAYYS